MTPEQLTPAKLVEFTNKYDEHIIAIETDGFNIRLFDAKKLLREFTDWTDTKDLDDQTSKFAKDFALQINSYQTLTSALTAILQGFDDKEISDSDFRTVSFALALKALEFSGINASAKYRKIPND